MPSYAHELILSYSISCDRLLLPCVSQLYMCNACVWFLGDDIIPQLLFSETVHERIDGKDSLCLKVDVALGGSSDGSNFYSITVTRTTLSGESEDVIQMITGVVEFLYDDGETNIFLPAVVSPSLQVLEEKYSSKSTVCIIYFVGLVSLCLY